MILPLFLKLHIFHRKKNMLHKHRDYNVSEPLTGEEDATTLQSNPGNYPHGHVHTFNTEIKCFEVNMQRCIIIQHTMEEKPCIQAFNMFIIIH